MKTRLTAALLMSLTAADQAEVRREIDASAITCSSAVRLKHVRTGRVLKSQDMNYGGGSQ